MAPTPCPPTRDETNVLSPPGQRQVRPLAAPLAATTPSPRAPFPLRRPVTPTLQRRESSTVATRGYGDRRRRQLCARGVMASAARCGPAPPPPDWEDCDAAFVAEGFHKILRDSFGVDGRPPRFDDAHFRRRFFVTPAVFTVLYRISRTSRGGPSPLRKRPQAPPPPPPPPGSCRRCTRRPGGWSSPPPRGVAVAAAPAARRGIDAHCRRKTRDSLVACLMRTCLLTHPLAPPHSSVSCASARVLLSPSWRRRLVRLLLVPHPRLHATGTMLPVPAPLRPSWPFLATPPPAEHQPAELPK